MTSAIMMHISKQTTINANNKINESVRSNDEALIKEIYKKHKVGTNSKQSGVKRPARGRERAPDVSDSSDDDDDSVPDSHATPVKKQPRRAASQHDKKAHHRQAATDVYRDFDPKSYHALWDAKQLPPEEKTNRGDRGTCDECGNTNTKTRTMCGSCLKFIHLGACHHEHIRKKMKQKYEKEKRKSTAST